MNVNESRLTVLSLFIKRLTVKCNQFYNDHSQIIFVEIKRKLIYYKELMPLSTAMIHAHHSHIMVNTEVGRDGVTDLDRVSSIFRTLLWQPVTRFV